ncbi:MAG: TetR/AcrR family transcriptional regulator [Bradyrhizobium sp.]|uniref:TetR/AcrR family transcriptional regulator n=1 Tax=Bradyrhizobium sp. TaxID=376 RepID=UPI002725CB66|nr:TetR/AcrR family transcriptional regulator [Bradyrhizobium sp.]MDO8399107.1 TetR/AcrR family transcriptional regulator [Bradyrhizobium sp.]
MKPTRHAIRRDSFHHGDTKRAAVDAALALIAEHGQHAVTLRAVAEILGVNHRALYRQYTSREDLLFAVAERGFARLADLLEAIPVAELDCGRTALAQCYASFALAEPQLYDLMFALPLRKCFHDAEGIGPQLRRVVKAAAVTIQAGHAPPIGSDATRIGVLRVWGLTHGLIGLYRAGALKARSDRSAVQFMVDAARALAPAAERLRP